MPNSLGWDQIALRLALAVAAGFIVGLDRGERGHAAGLRTMILVCVAAAMAMIQANLLLAHTANGDGHTITLDLMRLPLGILSGIGFIGAGAILRRGEMIRGVTTAATIWLMTVLGLCFGGGQIGLGLAGLLIALVGLTGLRRLEPLLLRERQGTLAVEFTGREAEASLRRFLEKSGFEVRGRHIAQQLAQDRLSLRVNLRYRFDPARDRPAELIRALATLPQIALAEWTDIDIER